MVEEGVGEQSSQQLDSRGREQQLVDKTSRCEWIRIE